MSGARATSRIVQVAQLATLFVMWLFVLSVSVWVAWLGVVSYRLSDAFTASMAISVVALPVYWTLAGILTYVFFGLRRGARDTSGRAP